MSNSTKEKLWLKIFGEHVNRKPPTDDELEIFQISSEIHKETNGSKIGFELFINWDRRNKNPLPMKESLVLYHSHRKTSPANLEHLTVNELRALLKPDELDRDADPINENANTSTHEQDIVLEQSVEPAAAPKRLKQYAVTREDVKDISLDTVFALAFIAIIGQWTVIYAKYNTGKTLLLFYLLMEAIRNGSINAQRLFYFNLDDTPSGIAEKFNIAQEFGFHMICEGYNDFETDDFVPCIEELCENGDAMGTILILDTLKKFTDLMDKRRASKFGQMIRRFIVKGGTVIALAHVNKHPGGDGKAVPAGTSDIIDDADCAYVIEPVNDDGKTKVIELSNKKRRGNVASSMSYSYSVEDGMSYDEILASFHQVDEEDVAAFKQIEAIKSDTEIIDAVLACIKGGIDTKMRLRDAVSDRIGCSKRAAVKVIEKYSGVDPAVHRWTYSVRARGAITFSVLDI